MKKSRYQLQNRGEDNAYRRYLAGMTTSLKQKVALTAAHLLCEGHVVDMGMGSGAGSHALACLYPNIQVTGVDVNPKMVELAQKNFKAKNLDFVVGDIARKIFETHSLNGIFNSSVLHHVTTFNDYRHKAAEEALYQQVEQLAVNGVLIVRDFLAPKPAQVFLDLPADDGDQSNDPLSCSSVNLLKRFSQEFRQLSSQPGFIYKSHGKVKSSLGDHIERFNLSHKLAIEFVLRKDYRKDWDTEVLEEYTYFTQDYFEALFAKLGLRTLASIPLYNPWIIRNRFQGKFEIYNQQNKLLPYPSSNYIIVGEKVKKSMGIKFISQTVNHHQFLEMSYYKNKINGKITELVRRPGLTIDILPWFTSNQDLYILARKSYPRPIMQDLENRLLDGRKVPAYVTEPLNVLQQDKPIGQTVEESLQKFARISAEEIHQFQSGCRYYPSPGGIVEEITSVFVNIKPRFIATDLSALSGFSSSGHVRAIEAQQLLRASQVGGLLDARLELNTYKLLRQLNMDYGPWIGESITVKPLTDPIEPSSLAELLTSQARRNFEITPARKNHFLQLKRAAFDEYNEDDTVVGSRELEYVETATLSLQTVSILPVIEYNASQYIGIDDSDLPAAQCFNGNSNLWVVPAWRLPKSIQTLPEGISWSIKKMTEDFGLDCTDSWQLGGPYAPSCGVTSEVVFPFVTTVKSISKCDRPLKWVKLKKLVDHDELLVDGHLRISVYRLLHALGMEIK